MRRPLAARALPAVLLAVVVLAAGLLASFPSSSPPAGAPVPAAAGAAAVPPAVRPGGAISVGAQGQLLVNTTDPAGAPNDGLEMNVSAFAGAPFAADSSFQAAATEVIGTHDAVFGFFENTAMAPTPFFAVYSNSTDASEHLAYWPGLLLQPGEGYLFALTAVNGSTQWSLTVNGELFGDNTSAADFDFGANRSTWAGGISFSETALYPSAPTAPMVLTVPLAFAVHRPAGWYLPDEGRAYFHGSGGSPWGVEGRLQHPTLAPGEIVTGTSIPLAVNGTTLWTGGPVPVRATIALTATAAVGLSNLAVTAGVTDTNGVPLPGVALTFRDLLNGSFTPTTALTNTSGSVLVAFSTPNVTANATDLVTALVTTFGYLASAEASIAISPALEVTIDAPGVVPLSPSGAASVTFTTRSPDGSLLPGVPLAFSLRAAGSLSPAQGITDASGSITVFLALPSTATGATVEVRVIGSGLWGQATVTLTFGAPAPPSFLSRYGDAFLAAALVAVAAGVILVGIRRWRRGRQALPVMPVRRYWKEIRPPRGPPPPPVSRTPP